MLAAATVIDAVAARLVPMVATAGRVYTSRAWPLDTLPAWRVTAESEDVVQDTVPEPINRHTLRIVARAYTRATADLDDALHALAASGLALLFAPTVPYSLALQSIDRDMTGDGEAAIGAVSLSMTAFYFVDPAAPETIIA